MSLLLHAYSQSSYRLADDLLPTLDVRRIKCAEPGEADREELVLRKLGPRGWGRLYQFRHFYGPGWGEGRGRALSPRAVEAFYKFLETVEFPAGVKPSIFLTDEGGLEISWEDAKGKAVQAAFLPTHIEVYRARDESERELRLGEASVAAEFISHRHAVAGY
jgi:hypothetical protein